MADSQDQGKPTVDEVVQQVEEQGKELAVKAETVTDRLDKYFEKRKTQQQPPATPEEPMPSSEQVKADTPIDEVEALGNSKNPERTKTYIERLKAERDEALAKAESKAAVSSPSEESAFDSFRVPEVPQGNNYPQPNLPYLNPQQVNQITDQFVDQQGNVDINGLNNALTRANQSAQMALDEARRSRDQLERFEENQQVREAHAQVPEIDPHQKDKFNRDLFEAVRDRLLRNMYEGKKQSLLEVASELKSKFTPSINLEKIKEEAITQYKTNLNRRDQGPIESGKGENRETASNIQTLRERTRKGDPFALDERMRKAGILK